MLSKLIWKSIYIKLYATRVYTNFVQIIHFNGFFLTLIQIKISFYEKIIFFLLLSGNRIVNNNELKTFYSEKHLFLSKVYVIFRKKKLKKPP